MLVIVNDSEITVLSNVFLDKISAELRTKVLRETFKDVFGDGCKVLSVCVTCGS